eukprot:jgi/Undpi1/9162/HiC_scaffold_26.g11620.m1
MAELVESGGVVLECCLEGVESANQACIGGVHRIELCANLAQGGVTPSLGDVQGALLALAGSKTRVHVLIRPRPGDFVYTGLEKQVMEDDVTAAVKAGAHGVVIGTGDRPGFDLRPSGECARWAGRDSSTGCGAGLKRASARRVSEMLETLAIKGS